jgi:hypothetical protein
MLNERTLDLTELDFESIIIPFWNGIGIEPAYKGILWDVDIPA